VKGEDVVTRAEQRLLGAMDQLITLVQAKRHTVFDLVNPVVGTDDLTNKWLLQTLSQLTPGTMMVYPQRLAEWRQANLLLYNEAGDPEPNSVCCLLLARMINPNRTAWLPRPPTLESYWCWRLNARHHESVPYEMPLFPADPVNPAVVSKPSPPVEEVPYVLYTNWKGASWDNTDAWLTTGGGVIRWVGEPTVDQFAQWLSPREMASLASGTESHAERARQVLRILAANLFPQEES